MRFIPKIEYIKIKDYEFSANLFNDITINTKEWKVVTLQFFDSDMKIVKNREVHIEMQVLQGPSYTHNLKLLWSYVTQFDNNYRIDDKGEMKLR